ncbi:MAG: phenylacetic acid degradation operon negative regulatory protein [Pseudonocardiales bacterium]|nr:phenylacetic acid degradation operon negative regulatory protein [Pseudonocardiales bacterium]
MRVTIDDDTNGRGQKPRALIVTIYGLYARELGGWMSVASIVRLMAELGVDEPAVRSSISRLKRRGILEAERVDGLAGYTLSQPARTILDEGDRRIFQRQRATLDEGWLLAVFSVPEAERDRRHQLRSRLAWLGFGTVSAGVWIAPAHLYGEAKDVLERHGLTAYVDLFRAEHLGFADVGKQVPQWWDLARLQGLYDDFLGRYGSVLTGYRRKRRDDERQAFADYAAALTDWRRLPYSDPGLAREVLPRGWNGARAAETFFELRTRLADPAHRFVDSVRQQVR